MSKAIKILALILAVMIVFGIYTVLPLTAMGADFDFMPRSTETPSTKPSVKPSATKSTTSDTSTPAKKKLNGWQQKGGSWHYYVKDKAQEGWLFWRGAWYWLDPSYGGAMATGWVFIDSTWYYFHYNGKMAAEEWLLLGGIWYYFRPSGAMAANERLLLGGRAYRFNESGACTNP